MRGQKVMLHYKEANMKYKLVCIDMDGTLLDERGEITKENKEALQKLSDKGIRIAITTGRMHKFVKAFSKMIGIEVILITSNGASIALTPEEAPFYNEVMKGDALRQFYTCAKHHDVKIHFTTANGIILDYELPADHIYHGINKGIPKEEQIELVNMKDFEEAFKTYDGQIIKALCIHETDQNTLDNLREELEQFGDYEIVSSWKNNIEVMPKGMSKGNAVKKLAQKLNISLEEVVCMGDSENDLSMLQIAGLAVAMGNAREDIKAAADYVTATNNESGVAKAINKFILTTDND